MNDQSPTIIDTNQNSAKAIIIFIKNPQLGKVKTRLAATVGNERALEIYHILMAHTREITLELDAEKYLYYSDYIDVNDDWYNNVYNKHLQFNQNDLGLKMAHAFREMIQANHKKVIIIGSDCLELTEYILEDAFNQLANTEVVIGPATDGGYYLIGFNFDKIGERCGEVLGKLFFDKQWSHTNVCKEAIDTFQNLGLTYNQLQTLNDVDEEKDVKHLL